MWRNKSDSLENYRKNIFLNGSFVLYSAILYVFVSVEVFTVHFIYMFSMFCLSQFTFIFTLFPESDCNQCTQTIADVKVNVAVVLS